MTESKPIKKAGHWLAKALKKTCAASLAVAAAVAALPVPAIVPVQAETIYYPGSNTTIRKTAYGPSSGYDYRITPGIRLFTDEVANHFYTRDGHISSFESAEGMRMYCVDPVHEVGTGAYTAAEANQSALLAALGYDLGKLDLLEEYIYFGGGYQAFGDVDHSDESWYAATQTLLWRKMIEFQGSAITSTANGRVPVAWNGDYDLLPAREDAIEALVQQFHENRNEVYADVHRPDGTEVSASNPAIVGETVTISGGNLWAWHMDPSGSSQATLVEETKGELKVRIDGTSPVIAFASSYLARQSGQPQLFWECGNGQRIMNLGDLDPRPSSLRLAAVNEIYVEKMVGTDYVQATVSLYEMSENGSFGQKALTYTTSTDGPVRLSAPDAAKIQPDKWYFMIEESVEPGYRPCGMPNPKNGYAWSKPANVPGTPVDLTWTGDFSGYLKDGKTIIGLPSGSNVPVDNGKAWIQKKGTDGNALPGAVLAVYDGGTKVTEFTSGTSARDVTDLLVAGKTYTVREISAPEGYVLTKAAPTIKPEANKTVTAALENYQVKFLKVDEDGNPLAGAGIEVRRPDGTVADTWVTDGNAHVIKGLEEGIEYTIVETAVPDGFLPFDSISFKPEDFRDQVISGADEAKKPLWIRKLDAASQPVAGAVLQIVDSATKEVVMEWTTDEGAWNAAEALADGRKYILREAAAPEGYVKAKDVEFAYNRREETEISMTDIRIPALKTDEEGNPLAGARLAVYEYAGPSIILSEDGSVNEAGNNELPEPVDEWISEIGPHYVRNLAEGQIYALVELDAPAGYGKADPVLFVADSEQSLETIRMVDKALHVYVDVLKKDAATKKPLEGAEFTICRKSDGVAVETISTGADGKASCVLRYDADSQDGWYIMETKAPEGYLNDAEGEKKDIVPDESYTFENTDKSFSFTYTDTLNTVLRLHKRDSETGDTPQNEASFAGAEYTLYDDKGAVAHVFVFDGNGETQECRNLRKDIAYTLKETKVPRGYRLDRTVHAVDFSRTALEDNCYTLELELPEDVVTGSIRIHKVESESDSSEIVKNEKDAEFTVIAAKHVEQYGSFEEAAAHTDDYPVKEWSLMRTGEDGIATSGELAYGRYVMRQTKASKETKLLEGDYEFEIQSQGETVRVEAVNRSNPYRIRIVKRDAETGEKVEYTGASFTVTKVKDKDGQEIDEPVVQKVAGKEYSVFRTASIKDGGIPAGTFVVPGGSHGETATPLTVSAGVYEVAEIQAPDGYTLTDGRQKKYIVEVSEGAAYSTVDEDGIPTITVTIANSRAHGKLLIRKTVEDAGADANLIEDLSGIEFTVVARKDIVDPQNGKIITKAGQAYGKYATDSEGKITVDNMPLGEYSVFESATPAGIVLKTEPYDFEFKQDDEYALEYTAEYILENDVTKVEVSKTDATGDAELPGAALQILDSDGNVVDSWISGVKPHMVAGLDAGKTYILHEEITPVDEDGNDIGYVRASDIRFTVAKDGSVTHVRMVDKVVTMSKVDVAGEEVEGAQMSVLDKDGNVVDTWVSGKDPHRIRNLDAGRAYTLHEEIAADGYVIANDVSFTVGDDGTNQHVQMTDIAVYSEKTDLGGEEVPGASMQVIDENGDLIDSWISGTEPHMIRNLHEGGKYILHEENAPDGYYFAQDIAFTVDAESIDGVKKDMHVDMTDMPIVYKILKIDDFGDAVEGVKLRLRDITDPENPADITGLEGQDADGCWITGTEPIVLAGVLKAEHTYELEESEFVAGVYQAAAVQFTVAKHGNADAKPVTVTMVDQTVDAAILKTDESGKPLAGAVLQVIDENGRVLHEWTSDSETKGEDISAYVKGGETYVLHEVSAPFGYELFDDFEFKVSGKTGYRQTIRATDVRKHFYVSVIKVDKQDESKRLKGAEFTVYDKDGNVLKDVNGKECVGVTDGSGVVVFEVAYGEGYYLMETAAPAGYRLSKEKYSAVPTSDYGFAAANPVVVKVLDSMMPVILVPKTGDQGVAMWVLLLAACAAMLAGGLFARRRMLEAAKEE